MYHLQYWYPNGKIGTTETTFSLQQAEANITSFIYGRIGDDGLATYASQPIQNLTAPILAGINQQSGIHITAVKCSEYQCHFCN